MRRVVEPGASRSAGVAMDCPSPRVSSTRRARRVEDGSSRRDCTVFPARIGARCVVGQSSQTPAATHATIHTMTASCFRERRLECPGMPERIRTCTKAMDCRTVRRSAGVAARCQVAHVVRAHRASCRPQAVRRRAVHGTWCRTRLTEPWPRCASILTFIGDPHAVTRHRTRLLDRCRRPRGAGRASQPRILNIAQPQKSHEVVWTCARDRGPAAIIVLCTIA